MNNKILLSQNQNFLWYQSMQSLSFLQTSRAVCLPSVGQHQLLFALTMSGIGLFSLFFKSFTFLPNPL